MEINKPLGPAVYDAIRFGFKRIRESFSDSELLWNDLKSCWHSNNLKMFLEMYKGKN